MNSHKDCPILAMMPACTFVYAPSARGNTTRCDATRIITESSATPSSVTSRDIISM